MNNITVVIPNYNNAPYLEDCIKSVENQSYPVQEIIVVDDCSTDNSLAVLEELKERYDNIVIHRQERNRGVSCARNIGLSLVKTEYVTFVDADDFYVNPNKIENEMSLIEFMKRNRGKDVVAYSITVICSNEGIPDYPDIKRKEFYLNGHIHFQLLQMLNWKSIMRDYCVKADILRKIGGYREDRNLFEDWELLIKIARNTDFYCTMEYGPGYRLGQSGLSSRPAYVYEQTIRDIFQREVNEYGLLYRAWAKSFNRIFNLLKKVKHKIF